MPEESRSLSRKEEATEEKREKKREKEEQCIDDGEMTLEELKTAQLDSQARKASAQKLLAANTELEQVVTSVVNMESNSLIAAEQELMEAKHLLSGHKLRRARRSVLRAEANLAELEEEVLKPGEGQWLLFTDSYEEKDIASLKVENIRLDRNATSAAEHGNDFNCCRRG